MYSLGIVLLELLTCFHTTMERHKSIEQLRAPQQHLPPSLVQRWPLLVMDRNLNLSLFLCHNN